MFRCLPRRTANAPFAIRHRRRSTQTALAMTQDAKDITKWADKDGEFRRQASVFRDEIKPGGRFPPASGRYFLYVSYACPWAHRTLIVRKLKGLEDHIGLSIVHPFMGPDGWSWTVPEEHQPDFPGVVPDPLYGFSKLRELYYKAQEGYSGRFTVPVLWDSHEHTIVNNESSEIIRMFNSSAFGQFNELVEEKYAKVDLYPETLRPEIDETNSWVYDTINNGVYKSGFATTQKAYEGAVRVLFGSLDRVEKVLDGGAESLVGGRLTEADVRLFTTLIRFDPVYVGHFKCNIGTIRDNFPNIHKYMQKLYWNYPAFKDTTNFDHIKTHYYRSHTQINPTRVVPLGPDPHVLPL